MAVRGLRGLIQLFSGDSVALVFLEWLTEHGQADDKGARIKEGPHMDGFHLVFLCAQPQTGYCRLFESR